MSTLVPQVCLQVTFYLSLSIYQSINLSIYQSINLSIPVVAGKADAVKHDVSGVGELVGHANDLVLGVGQGACP